MILLNSNSVYVVLEYHIGTKHSEHLHGVYTTAEIANKVADKLRIKKESGYICVLKKRIKGPTTQLYVSKLRRSDDM